MTDLKNYKKIVFTKCNIGANGVMIIKSKSNKPFPKYSENYSFQGGGELQFCYKLHKSDEKL